MIVTETIPKDRVSLESSNKIEIRKLRENMKYSDTEKTISAATEERSYIQSELLYRVSAVNGKCRNLILFDCTVVPNYTEVQVSQCSPI